MSKLALEASNHMMRSLTLCHFKEGSKEAEYQRSIEHFETIFNTQGVYFALAFLYDAQYENSDLKAMVELLDKQRGEL